MKIIHSLALITCATPLMAVEFSGWLALQGQLFADDGLNDQSQHNLSFAVQPELYHPIEDTAWEINAELFARIDQEDDERSHADIRELHALGVYEEWEFKIGLSIEYWGATEFAHLVDVINQTDYVENIDGEDKFGQQMLKATWYSEWGSIETFILPGFRERSFPSNDGRFLPVNNIDTDKAEYESSAEEWHVDGAIRFNGSFDSMDLGIAIFTGTNRDPLFRFSNGSFIPYYELMTQVSIDATIPQGDALYKIELRHRDSDSDTYVAASAGIEHTFVGVFETDYDIGLLAEYIWDERDEDADSFLQKDIFLGLRLALNDSQDTSLLTGFVQDLDDGGHLFSLEFERRLNDDYSIEIQARSFGGTDNNDPLHGFRKDDYLQVEIFYHF